MVTDIPLLSRLKSAIRSFHAVVRSGIDAVPIYPHVFYQRGYPQIFYMKAAVFHKIGDSNVGNYVKTGNTVAREMDLTASCYNASCLTGIK